MRYLLRSVAIVAVSLLFFTGIASAHFGMIIPSDEIVSKADNKNITLHIQFIHPFEGSYMNMERPEGFGVFVRGQKEDLLKKLKKRTVRGFTTWEATYRVKGPGDMIFYVEPAPYWEPAEESFIIHYTKVVVNALGLEEGWDAEVGLPVEIIPLTRPYGLWAGNVFQGVVKFNGKPVPFAEVEVEYYNKDSSIKPPADPYITQVIKADKNGVFTYAMPRAGWWGFAALVTAPYKLEREGKSYPVELGGVIWVKTRNMR